MVPYPRHGPRAHEQADCQEAAARRAIRRAEVFGLDKVSWDECEGFCVTPAPTNIAFVGGEPGRSLSSSRDPLAGATLVGGRLVG